MANELITGANGAGKTVFAVAKRMLEEVGRSIEYEDEHGVKHTAQRRILAAGFRDLLIEHHKLPHPLTGEVIDKRDIERWNALDADDQPVMERLPFSPPIRTEVVNGKTIPLQHTLFNWWLWVQPGDMLCFDEIQYVVPRGTMGKSPPLWMRKIEIHRHYGIDFLFITPHPQLIDMNLRALINPHRHVRSVSVLPGRLGLCVVYVWDHASNPERLTNSQKTFFRRKPSMFALYKSTAAVMRQPAAGKGYLVFAPLVLILCAVMAYRVVAPKSGVADLPLASAHAVTSLEGGKLPAPGAPGNVAGSLPDRWVNDSRLGPIPLVQGCYTHGDKCSCVGVDGLPVARIAPQLCRESVAGFAGVVKWAKRDPLPEAAARAGANASVGPAGAALAPFKTASAPGV